MTKVLVAGGAGFIGINLVMQLLKEEYEVIVIDNLSRKGTDKNLSLILNEKNMKFYKIDIGDLEKIEEVFDKEKSFDAVFHLAGQVAVTTSVMDPRNDFEVNALGSFNILEQCRLKSPESKLIYASTNKVYGDLSSLNISEGDRRYILSGNLKDIDEDQNLDFHSPYGCSKGCADQYFRDYARIYGLNTLILRQSCIYGTNQYGIEDQGWVAWFAICGILGRPITIYGNGKQVRDVLFIDDLVELYLRMLDDDINLNGQIFNIGGGYKNSISLIELLELLKSEFGITTKINYSEIRPGDQPYYVSNIGKVTDFCDWRPKTDVKDGLSKMINWIKSNIEVIKSIVVG
jgi:CDP-paratose 2-epimerase